MPDRFAHIPPEIAAPLRAYDRRCRLNGLVRAVLWAVALEIALAVVVMHVDRFAFLGTGLRVGLFWGVQVIVGVQLVRCLWGLLLRRPTAREVAYRLERQLPDDACECYVTIEDILGGPGNVAGEAEGVRGELVRALAETATAYSRQVRGQRLVRDRRIRVAALLAVVLVAVCSGLACVEGYQFGLMARRFVFPLRNLPKPSFIRLAIVPDSIVVGRGEEIVLQAELSGRVPPGLGWLLDLLDMSPRHCLVTREGADPQEMTRIQRRLFLHTYADMTDSFRFRVKCGDALTEWRLAEVIAQPRVEPIRVTVRPPQYTGLPESEVADIAKPIPLLPQTQVTITFGTDQAVVQHRLVAGKGRQNIEPEWDEAARQGTHSFVMQASTTLQIEVENGRGFANVDRPVLTFSLLDDQPPSVRLEGLPAEIERVSGELVPMRVAVDDDFGIAELAARYQLNPGVDPDAPFQELPVELADKSGTAVQTVVQFDLDRTGAVPGDEVMVDIRARDTAGNDGLSRPLLVRIVPFTRGENERRRIAALRFVDHFLRRVAEAGEEGLTPDLYAELRQEAGKRHVPLPEEEPSMASVLALLEREHHFTDDPRHKQTVRKLCGLVQAGSPQAAELLPTLAHSRSLRNILWRLFGMSYEIARVRAKLDELTTVDPDPAAQDALRRRAKLYLATLQDLGDELITLARQVDVLDADSLTRGQGELNTAAYYLTRGSLNKNIRSADAISVHLAQLIEELRPALPTLGSAENSAVAALDLAYDGVREGAREEGDSAWFDRQSRMMACDPFASSWEQVRAFQAAVGTAEARAGGDGVETATEADWLRRLAAQWARAEIQGTPRISTAERELALQLLADDYSLAPAPGNLKEAERRLASVFADGGTAACRDKLRRATTALDDVPDVGRSDQLPAALAASAAAVARIERGTTDLSLQLRFADVADAGRLADDILLMRLRGASSRYRLQAGSYLRRLAAADTAEPDAARLGELIADVQGLAVARRAFAATVTKLLDEHESGLLAGDQARASYQLYPLLERSRSLAGYIDAVAEGTDAAETARALLETSPEARLDYLADEAAAGRRAAELLDTCKVLLEADPVRVADYDRARTQAQKLVARVKTAALEQPEIQGAADEVVNRIERLAIAGQPETGLVRQRLFSLGEAQQQLERLNRRINMLVTQRDDATSGFSGGPPGIWERESRTDAEHARRRLLQQMRFAQQRATMSILAGLQPQADHGQTANGFAWSRFYHRVIRSDLAGPLRQRARRRDDEQQGDRFLRWLTAELETARKAARADDGQQNVYRPITLEYLDSMADFLRY